MIRPFHMTEKFAVCEESDAKYYLFVAERHGNAIVVDVSVLGEPVRDDVYRKGVNLTV